MPASVRRVFKTKRFHKAAGKAGIADGELCRAVRELARGQGVDLGGNVWKKSTHANGAPSESSPRMSADTPTATSRRRSH